MQDRPFDNYMFLYHFPRGPAGGGMEIHLPPGVDLSAYRVVQEALTNVRKHALGVNRVDIVVRHSPGGVELEICDDGRPVVPPTTAGFGLIGLRERVALHGGQLHAGAVLPRGYRVWVRLPTVSDAST